MESIWRWREQFGGSQLIVSPFISSSGGSNCRGTPDDWQGITIIVTFPKFCKRSWQCGNYYEDIHKNNKLRDFRSTLKFAKVLCHEQNALTPSQNPPLSSDMAVLMEEARSDVSSLVYWLAISVPLRPSIYKLMKGAERKNALSLVEL